MVPLNKSPFSRHFNMLIFLGAWYYQTENNFKLNLYIVYKVSMTAISVFCAVSLMVDLYLVWWDLKKMSWNLCVSVFYFGVLEKNFQLLPKSDVINRLRMRLHEDAESRGTAEDIVIHDSSLRELKLLQLFLYGSAMVFIPAWLITRYFNYRGELPVPFRLPFYVDLNDDKQFGIVFIAVGLIGVGGLILGIETELAMFGLMIQISREYSILMKDIPQLNELYDNKGLTEKEVNPFLKKSRTKFLVKRFSARQNELFEYTKEFEGCYNQSFLIELFSISLLFVILGVQFMLENVDFSGNVVYQIGYMSMTATDLFLLCWFSTRLHFQCIEVGEVAYSTLWYRMETECQKDIAMIIMRAQNPPRISAGKLMPMDLDAFTSRVSNVISWLTLFRELLVASRQP